MITLDAVQWLHLRAVGSDIICYYSLDHTPVCWINEDKEMINIWDAWQNTQHGAFERFHCTIFYSKLIQYPVADDLIGVCRAMRIQNIIRCRMANTKFCRKHERMGNHSLAKFLAVFMSQRIRIEFCSASCHLAGDSRHLLHCSLGLIYLLLIGKC